MGGTKFNKLTKEDLEELDEFTKEHEKDVGPSNAPAALKGPSVVENEFIKNKEEGKDSVEIPSSFKQLARSIDSPDSQIDSECVEIPSNPYQVPDFNESKYAKEFMELRKKAMKCEGLSYLPRCVNGEDSSYSSISSDSSYISLIEKLDSDINP